MVTGTKSRVSTHSDDETSVVWLPDGKNLLYGGRREGHYRIFVVRADGSGTERQIREDPALDVWPMDVSADGKWLLFGAGSMTGFPDGTILIAPLAEGGVARMLIPESDGVLGAALSPDLKWLAFDAVVSGRREVYVSPLSTSGEGLTARWQVSTNGGDRPRWRRDGRELYYVRADANVMAVSFEARASEFRVTQQAPLFQAFQRFNGKTFDPSRDAAHFVVNIMGGDEGDPLAVVTNWTQTLTAR